MKSLMPGWISIRKSRAVFIFVTCCSLATIAMFRMQFLVHQSMLDRPWIKEKIGGSTKNNNSSSSLVLPKGGRRVWYHPKSESRLTNIASTKHNTTSNDYATTAHISERLYRTRKAHERLNTTVTVSHENKTEYEQEKQTPSPGLDEKRTQIAVDDQENTTVPPTAHSTHHPHYFTDTCALKALVARDNMLSVVTGCSIAAWTYTGVYFVKNRRRFYDDCHRHHMRHNLTMLQRSITSDTVIDLLRPGDTVYVEFKKVHHFVNETLPKIHVDIVLISGQNHLVPQKPQKLDYVWSSQDFDAICNNPHITHWFLMNMDVYAQNPNHDKLHPFPYGLGTTDEISTPDTARVGMNPMEAFRNEMNRTAHENDDISKKSSIFVGYFTRRTNKAKRRMVPRGDKLSPSTQFRRMYQSSYVVSPNGDRPDCYRHYEAIGLGATPITQMHPKYYRHLAGNVIFNNTNWNLTELEASLPERPTVNRRLVYEEYWMEYVERTVGRPLRWWDPSRNIRCSLDDITSLVKITAAQ